VSIDRRAYSVLAFFLALLLPATIVAVLGQPVAAHANPAHCPATADDETAALQTAASCHGRVEVTSERDERTQVFADPGGTLTAQTSAVAQRVRDASGAWVRTDPALHSDGRGRYAPAATVLKLSFSGGGADDPAVTITQGAARLGLIWPGTLPAPIVAGASATYRDVLPGVDLVLTAQVEGFAEMLVVKDVAAADDPALDAVHFGVNATGLTLQQDAAGTLSAVDASGAAVFGSSTPAMWDSTVPAMQRPDGPSTASRLAVPSDGAAAMPVQLSGGALVIHPNLAMLRDARTQYPVYIDPSIGKSAWTMINSLHTTQSYWSYDRQDCPAPFASVQCAKVGYTNVPSGMIYRSMFSFGIGNLLHKHIQDAKLSMDTVYSYDNSDAPTQVRVTNGISTSTTWSNNASSWQATVIATAKSHAHDRVRRRTEWGVTSAMQKAATGTGTSLTLGLRAVSESTLAQWKKFDAGTAVLTVIYNSYPNAPDQITVDGAACKSGTARPYVRTLTPALKARLSDPDGTGRLLKGTFYWWKLTGGARNVTDSVAQTAIVSGQPSIVHIPAGKLTDGTTYVMQAITNDGIDNGQYSTTCEFTVDVTPPGTPGGVTSADYPADGQAHGGAGTVGCFTLAAPATLPPDLDGYAYTLDPGTTAAAASQVAVDATLPDCPGTAGDHGARVHLAPPADRTFNLRVWARDHAGNFSVTPLTYTFTVRAGTGPDARWTFDDSTGADDSEHGNTATLTAADWGPGRGSVGNALKADGASTYAATTGPIATKDPTTGNPVTVHSNGSFTLATTVWLNGTTGSGQRVIVAQDGAHTSPFMLSYSVTDRKWRFAVAATDADVPVTAAVLSNAVAAIGVWTRLVATYDGTTHALKLYVNGVLQTATATSGTFDAIGPVTIGRGLQASAATGFFSGQIDDVRVYGRALLAAEQQFALLQMPNPPLVSFPSGTTGFTSKPFSAVISAGGDTSVTTVKYQLGAAGDVHTELLPTPGGDLPVSLITTDEGTPQLLAQGIDADGNISTITAKTVTFQQSPTLNGKVTDALTGAALAGVTVELSPGDLTTTTSSTGTYSFAGLDAGTYTLTAATSGVGCAAAMASTEIDVTSLVTRDLLLAPEADIYGYTCKTAAATAFVTGSTKLALTGDDATQHVASLPFTMPYYDHSYHEIWISTNGFLSFVDPTDRNHYTGVTLPDRHFAPWAAIAPYLSDLVIDASSGVYTATTGSGATQRYVVEWRNALIAGTTTRVTFEAVLSASGDIIFNYSGLTTDLAKGSDTVVGITSPGGNYGLQYSFQQPALVSGTAITVVHPTDPGPSLTGSLSGTITNSDGTPRPNAYVWLDDFATTTDSDGYYEFDDVENGVYNLYAAMSCDDAEDQNAAVAGASLLDLTMDNATDAFGDQCTLTNRSWIPGTTPLTYTSDYDATITLPFAVPFYGHDFTSMTVQKWAAVAFTDATDATLGGGVQAWPAADPDIDDQLATYTATVGTAPNRQFVIEWRGLGVAGVRANAELVFDEGTGAVTTDFQNVPARSLTDRDLESYYWGTDWNPVTYYEDGNGLRAGKTVTIVPSTQ
jgi:hypothetical protein